jgi:predicted 3-demethylubiquinone-9 3-methyltransferase (glyoxalase superfamily)
MQRITPFLWFDNTAEDAVNYYVSVFKNARIEGVWRYGKEASAASGQPEGTVMSVSFVLDGQQFVALNGGPHFRISEAVSFVVNCESQEEIDYYWNRLSDGGDPAAQRCGWLKDRFGVSWQIVPAILPALLRGADASKVMQALLQMGKLDLAALQRAHARKNTIQTFD